MNPQTPDLPLRDIHLPAAVSWWPPAPGWWIALGLCLLIALLLVWLKKRSQRIIFQHEARKEFQQLLQNYEEQHANRQQLLRDLNALLRRTVLSYYPRKNVAGLTGKVWIEQLHSLSGTAAFDPQAQMLLTQAAYMATPPEDLQPLIEQVKNWIEQLPRKLDPEQTTVTPAC